MARRALITGITGQDGSYLAELLLSRGYQVWGVIRRASTFNTGRIDHLYQDPHDDNVRLRLVYGDLTDAATTIQILRRVRPHEIYNLGAQSHVKVSFELPEATIQSTGLGCVRMLEAIRDLELECRFYQASSSEMYGRVLETPQTERTPFNPQSPYGAAKVLAFHMTRLYREAYGLFAVNGILFNHESPRRGETFVTRKITRAVAAIRAGRQKRLFLGNLEARRDWGYAPDYVEAMWRMLQTDEPEDFVIATGETHSVRGFCSAAFAHAGLPLEWTEGPSGPVGVGPDGSTLVEIDPSYFRPSEVDVLKGDASRARSRLGWEPRVRFEELVEIMVESDLRLIEGPDSSRWNWPTELSEAIESNLKINPAPAN